MQNFNFHQHTYRCGHADNNMTDEEYVEEYLKMGFKKIAFTDHCPEKEVIDTRTKMRMSYKERIEYLDSIKKLKEKYKDKIEILVGYEVEYLPGQEENLNELKKETDILILGQHFIYNKDMKSLNIIHNKENIYDDIDLNIYATYLENACKEGLIDIIAHPDIFMNARESFEITEEKITRRICEAAETYDIPIEINLNNIFGRLFFDKKNGRIKDLNDNQIEEMLKNVGYPCKEFWKIASEYNTKVIFGIDAHYRNQILLFNKLVKVAKLIIGEDIMGKLHFIENF